VIDVRAAVTRSGAGTRGQHKRFAYQEVALPPGGAEPHLTTTRHIGSRIMARPSPRQRKTIGRVMHEFSHGELKSGRSGKGGKVKSRKQAIAIALKEGGASRYESDKEVRDRQGPPPSRRPPETTTIRRGKALILSISPHQNKDVRSGDSVS